MKAAEIALIAIGTALVFLLLVAFMNLAAEAPRFTAWCTAQGGVMPNGWFDDPICVRDGLLLIPPKDSNARWPE